MRKVIAAFNMTLDGFCDHTSGIPDEEIHQHYTELIDQGSVILYGRTTYELMGFWQTLLAHPSDEESMNDFARAIDGIPKIVFSHTLQHVDWDSARLATGDLHDEVLELRKESGRPVLVGSRSLILQLLQLDLIDEFQLCIYPVVVGKGLRLFEDIVDQQLFELTDSKRFRGGAVLLTYKPKRSERTTPV